MTGIINVRWQRITGVLTSPFSIFNILTPLIYWSLPFRGITLSQQVLLLIYQGSIYISITEVQHVFYKYWAEDTTQKLRTKVQYEMCNELKILNTAFGSASKVIPLCSSHNKKWIGYYCSIPIKNPSTGAVNSLTRLTH